MAAKYQLLTELYESTGIAVAKNAQAWGAFLQSACRNYKCRFDEQLLIYVQRPDATAVAGIDTWNRLFKRWVNKDSKGIAVFDPKGNALKYYFDISDTHEGYYGSMPVPIWRMEKGYEQPVTERLKNRFGDVKGGTFADVLLETAKNAVEDNISDYTAQLVGCIEGSYLEGMDDLNIAVIYKRLTVKSVALMLFSRCGLDTEGYFDGEDFADIVDFNTPAVLNSIGIASSDISEMALREISLAIRNVQIERKKQGRTFAKSIPNRYDIGRTEKERSGGNERDHIQQTGGLPDSRSGGGRGTGVPAWQVRIDVPGLSGEIQKGDVHQSSDIGQAERTSPRSGADSTGAAGEDDRTAQERAGSGGRAERKSPDAVGAANERNPQPGGGSDTERTDIQLEAGEKISPAFSVSQEDIDFVLTKGSKAEDSKYRIYRQLWKGEDRKDNIQFLREEYGIAEIRYIFPDGREGGANYSKKGISIAKRGSNAGQDIFIKWGQAEKRLRELVRDGRYLSLEEKKCYADYLEKISAPRYEIDTEKKRERQRFIERNKNLPPASKRDTLPLRLSDFIRDLDGYEKKMLQKVERDDLSEVTEGQMEQCLSQPDTVQQLVDFLFLVRGGTTDAYSRSNAAKFSEELKELYPLRYRYKEGDMVYIGRDKYEISALSKDTVSLRNVQFPIFSQDYSREDFEKRLGENPANDYLKVIAAREEKTEEELLEQAKAYIDAFCANEYGTDEVDYTDLSNVELAFTSTEDGQHEIQASVDLLQYRTESRIDGVTVEAVQYGSLSELIEQELSRLSFDELIYVTEEQYKLFYRKKGIGGEKEPERRNYRITDESLGIGGDKEKFRNNIEAIHLLHELQVEKRLATPKEQEILARYVGWGGLPMAFDGRDAAWSEEYKELKGILSEEEYNDAMESTLTAFYTPPAVIKAMYGLLGRLGFTKGNILEPSCGVGGFFGMLPESMEGSMLYGIEIDPLSGRIAKQLYQKADISIEGFEDSKFPDGSFDVVVGNVPFGGFKVNDSRYNAHKFFIHDYFFAKALDKVRAGGVVMFLTSRGTMDKRDAAVRKYLAQRAELLGAVRLPDDAFKANAGTEVTSDIIILQKRDRVVDTEPDWLYIDTDSNGITINSYFVEHPEMVLGEMRMESTRFGMDAACKAIKDMPLPEILDGAMQRIKGQIPENDIEVDRISDGQESSIDADPDVRNFSFAIVDGKVYFRENNKMSPAKASVTAENRIRGLVEIRDCVRRIIQYQTDDLPGEMIQAEQKKLNGLYDAFTAKYGLINNRGNYLAFGSDESYFLLCSLEVLDDEGNFKRKADMFTKRTIKPHREITSVETASEALAVSIGEKACVDLGYMAQLTGKPQDEVISNLQGIIFKVPGSGPFRYVTADEYLSGNVRAKLIAAKAAAKENSEYESNVRALEKVIPKDLLAGEISVRLGTSWIPAEDIQQFILELLTPGNYAAEKLRVRYMSASGEWFIENKGSDYGNVKADSTYGTKRADAYRIIEDTLNLRDTRIFDYIYDEHENRKAVFNAKETMAAQSKQEVIKQAFQDWIWKDPERRGRLVRYYNDTFNCVRPREYDGSHITFSGISPEITLRRHQVNAIAHILYGGNTLLAHKVGAGKTFEMVAAAQESKRLGLCQKSMFVVPNHLVGQWASEYLRLYPSANILVSRKQDFEMANRKKFCGRIATGDYDAVIIGHSQFERIPISEERQREQLMRQLNDIEYGIRDAQASYGEQFTVKQLMKTKKAVKIKLDKLNNTKRKDRVVFFEELGIDRLFIDESHFYKNLYLYTKMRNVGGIAQTEAQKSSDLFMKCRYLDEVTGGRGIIFATGTPISNSMVELYSVQRYLQYDTLAEKGLQHFDSWASTFGETVTALELAPEGTNYRAKTRFAKFHNLPELMQMFKEVADIQTADMLKLPVPKVIYHNVRTKPSRIQEKMVEELAKRAERVRAKLVEPNVDNLLRITNDGRKLALDQRLIDPMLPDDADSKINACAGNVYRIWRKHADTGAAQLVFCDLATPKNDGSFNVYDDMREKLVRYGIPEKQVRFIHEASTDAQKKEMFSKVRSGEVRVLIGSTQKMGAGTNVQDRLIAIHNCDCPWKPSSLEQRQGRLERQGNMFPEVEVYRYVTERTFDAYLFQLVEGKQKFISQIMTSKSPVRSAEDVDETALSFAEVKMLATGDERFKEKMEMDMQVARLRVLKQSYLSEHYSLEDRVLKQYPKDIREYEERIEGYRKDAELAERNKPQDGEKFFPMILKGVTYTEKADAGEMLLAVCKENPMSQAEEVGSYRGFKMEAFYDTVNAQFCLNLCGAMKHKIALGADASGNLTRIENELARLPAKLEDAVTKRAETAAQLGNAKAELQKPFAFEGELKEKAERLNALNIELNLKEKDVSVMDAEPEQKDGVQERKSKDRER